MVVVESTILVERTNTNVVVAVTVTSFAVAVDREMMWIDMIAKE